MIKSQFNPNPPPIDIVPPMEIQILLAQEYIAKNISTLGPRIAKSGMAMMSMESLVETVLAVNGEALGLSDTPQVREALMSILNFGYVLHQAVLQNPMPLHGTKGIN